MVADFPTLGLEPFVTPSSSRQTIYLNDSIIFAYICQSYIYAVYVENPFTLILESFFYTLDPLKMFKTGVTFFVEMYVFLSSSRARDLKFKYNSLLSLVVGSF